MTSRLSAMRIRLNDKMAITTSGENDAPGDQLR
jgi:hypothetical protein